MKIFVCLTIAACGAVCGAAAAATAGIEPEATVLVFREEAYVKGPSVRLGEIAAIEGGSAAALGDVEVMPAAQPGSSKRLDASLVAARLRNAGYDGLDMQLRGARAVRATTLHQEITPAAIAEDLRNFIEQSMPWDPLATEVDVEPPSHTIVAPEGDIEFEWRAALDYGFLGSGAFRGAVRVDGDLVRTVTCRAVVQTYADLLVAATTIPRGKVIMPGDVMLETRLLSSLKEPAFQDPAGILGRFTARNTITPGQVIVRSALAPRVLVRRKQLVTVEMASGGLHVQTQAQAQADAAEGETVVCINTNSKQPFVGVVRSDGVVVVQ